MHTLPKLAALAALILAACSSSTPPSLPPMPTIGPPPIEQTAITDCPGITELPGDDLADIIAAHVRLIGDYADCRRKHRYLAHWINTTRTLWTTSTAPPNTKNVQDLPPSKKP